MAWDNEPDSFMQGAVIFITPSMLEIEMERLKRMYDTCHSTKYNLNVDPKKNLAIQNILGTYQILGHNPEYPENKYTGDITLFTEGYTIKAIWEIANESTQFGEGYVHGNMLYLRFKYTEEYPEWDGFVIYELTDHNQLTGFWIDLLSSNPGIEKLKKRN
ncbi:hypothetical protein [Aureibacter tunicatorum]|uniref:Uncharacterized protein n=1 Tax=Aureibacter tunicatorum TaxID=866807 RepID=A0AAE3XJR5_9BACT|nr:hypothetical protein [Aureibacter tunicatorum]MDR6237225.1 hypothetical protein [Aureibacter tunicatorum]BDD06217.1 hypothetical protein AUTU_37000 [Aureibacter tunicatorum]